MIAELLMLATITVCGARDNVFPPATPCSLEDQLTLCSTCGEWIEWEPLRNEQGQIILDQWYEVERCRVTGGPERAARKILDGEPITTGECKIVGRTQGVGYWNFSRDAIQPERTGYRAIYRYRVRAEGRDWLAGESYFKPYKRTCASAATGRVVPCP